MPNWNATFSMKNIENLIGAIIEKDGTIAECVDLEDYKKKTSEKTKLAVWVIVSKKTGRTIIRKTPVKFRFGDLPLYLPEDRPKKQDRRERGSAVS